MNANSLTLIVLVALSTASYVISGGGSATVIIFVAAWVKAALVGWQFMELRSAHPVWKWALGCLLTAILGIGYLVS